MGDIELPMLASRVGTGKQNAVANVQRADTAKTSRFNATTPTANEIVSRSKRSHLWPSLPLKFHRQFGSMTEKVADYEKVLRELLGRASEDDAKLIKSTLERVSMFATIVYSYSLFEGCTA